MQDIFRYFFAKLDDSSEVKRQKYGYATWFLDSFPMSEFEKEDKVMYDVISSAIKIKATLKERYLEVYNASMLKEFIVKNKITVPQTETLMLEDTSMLEEATRVIGSIVVDNYNELIEEDINMEDFVIDVKEWMAKQKKARLINICKETFKRVNSLTRNQIGVNDASKYLEEQSALINSIYSDEAIAQIDSSVQQLRMRPVFRSALDPIRKSIDAVYTTEVMTIAAGPGVGKTTMAMCDEVYNSAVNHKQNILAVCLEQTEQYIKALLVARHILSMNGKTLSANKIAKELYKDKETLELIEIARHDLFESGRYGKIYIYDKRQPFYLETMEATLDRLNNLYGKFDGIVLDHISVVQQLPGSYGKRLDIGSIAKQVYLNLVKYAGLRDVAIIAINQLNAKGALMAEQGKEVDIDSFAGGMETLRSSDYVIVIEQTPQMKINHMQRVYSRKVRVDDPVLPFMIRTWMMCGYLQVVADVTNLAK